MFELFESVSASCSRMITKAYSTSFSLGIQTLDKRFREPIYGIYAMVRFADEIVDTFHDHDKKQLLQEFRQQTFEAIDRRISLNPVLHSFQKVVHSYGIPKEQIEAFFNSMEMDLEQTAYGRAGYEEYIYGSAEVVGLMCLRVFTEGDEAEYQRLTEPARALGAAFQKVNFLRDMKSDLEDRGRVYFPGVDFANFETSSKRMIEAEIEEDFRQALKGIRMLPKGAREGVLLAYRYYMALFAGIKAAPAEKIKEMRIRVPDYKKFAVLLYTIAGLRVRYAAGLE